MGLIQEPEYVKVINVIPTDGRDIPALEFRLLEYGFILSKTIIYGYKRHEGKRTITNILYVLAVKPGKLKPLNTMLTQLQNARNLKIQHF